MVSESMLGRVLDGLGQPLDEGGGSSRPASFLALAGKVSNPLNRPLIEGAVEHGGRVRGLRSFQSARGRGWASLPDRESEKARSWA